jgi:rhamnosyltransferase
MAVQFCGKYAHNQWDEILSAHDVLVMPMICEETFSLVAREALQAGVPVIAARRGALPAVIEDGVNGLLFEPEDVADLRRCLLRLLNEPDLLDRLRSAQSQFKTVNEYAEEMEEIYREVYGEKGETAKRVKGEKEEENITSLPSSIRPVGQAVPAISAVSILIPTKNGAKYLAEVLDGVRKQQGDFRLQEIIAVDSGSRDETVQILKQYGVTVVQIPPQEFGHGKTRNLLASRAQGEYLVFLTQDATPASDRWLHNLLAPLQADSQVAGAYSRHLPRPTCHPMEWHRIVALDCPADSSVRSAIDNPDFTLHPERYRGFANTSSVLRRSVWEQFPFPEVDFAEDQAWAECVLRAGYKTAYVADSIIFHSHSYGPWTNFCRHFEHFVAMRQVFAQEPARKLKDCIPATLQGVRSDLAFWYQQSGQSKTHVALRWALPALSWYLAAEIGMWLGERYDRLPQWLVQRLSLQERVKRR